VKQLHPIYLCVKRAITIRQRALIKISLAGSMLIVFAHGLAPYLQNKMKSVALANTSMVATKCCGEIGDRRMIGTYYNTKENWKSELFLNNKGPNPIVITPVLYAKTGAKYIAPGINVAGVSAQIVDLNEIAKEAGQEFADGSYEFTYTGRSLEVSGGLRIVDLKNKTMFEEQLSEPGDKFPSGRAESVYFVPIGSTNIELYLTNTSDQPLVVKGESILELQSAPPLIDVALAAHETRIIRVWSGPVEKIDIGAVSLNYVGVKGGLLALVHISQSPGEYSASIPFTDPLKAKANKISGAGFRIGKINGRDLTPRIAVRNVGQEEITVTASIPLSKSKMVDRVVVPKFTLLPKQMRMIDTSGSRLNSLSADSIGSLDIEYSGAPGSLIASVVSSSPKSGEVFPLLMQDPQVIRASSGGYAWFAKKEQATTVYITNTSNEDRRFRADIFYPGGVWGSGIKSLAPGETFAFDIKQIRDSQVKGSTDNTIPLNAESGHFYWTIFESSEKILIGRAETVDSMGGMVATSESFSCFCNPGYYDGMVEPVNDDHHEPGGARNYRALQQDQDCFGNFSAWFLVTTVSWSTQNSNIATINTVGTVTAQNIQGSTGVVGEWNSSNGIINPSTGDCEQIYRMGSGVSSFTTDPPIAHHVRVTNDVGSYPPSCIITGIFVRQITVQVVNQFNRDVGSGSVREGFTNLTTNTCGNGAPNPTGCGTLDVLGRFTDTMAVSSNVCGSGISQSSGCGYTLTSTWSMCSGSQTQNIWTYNGETRSNGVLVNGSAGPIANGTYLFP
jgi:hypothetical protein